MFDGSAIEAGGLKQKQVEAFLESPTGTGVLVDLFTTFKNRARGEIEFRNDAKTCSPVVRSRMV